MKEKDDARVIWARGCEPPRPPQYPPNNEAPVLVWKEKEVSRKYPHAKEIR